MKHALKTATAAMFLAPLCFFSGSALAKTPTRDAPVAAQAAQAQLPKPALWTVKDDNTTIYLFGTIHALPPGEEWLSPTVKAALDSSNILIMEVIPPEDPSGMMPMIEQFAIRKDGATLSSRLPEADRAAFHAALANFSMPPTAFDPFKPWYAATVLSMMPLLRAGYDPAQGAEARLNAIAKASGKSIDSLESIDLQFSLFDGLSEKEQFLYLKDSVEMLDEATEVVDRIVGYWQSGQADEVGKVINESLETSPELAEVLLYRRNAVWAEQLQKRLDEPGTVFVAVGAGHLAGERSVQDYLKQRGLKVERVVY